MKIRIALQEIDGKKYQHKHNIVLETDDLSDVIKRIRWALSDEIAHRENKFLEYLQARKKDFIDKLISETDNDKIDWNSKGKDISKREYLENEMFSD